MGGLGEMRGTMGRGSRGVFVDADGLSGCPTLPVLALKLRDANPEPPGCKTPYLNPSRGRVSWELP